MTAAQLKRLVKKEAEKLFQQRMKKTSAATSASAFEVVRSADSPCHAELLPSPPRVLPSPPSRADALSPPLTVSAQYRRVYEE